MSLFTMPVTWYTSTPVHTIAADDDLDTLHHHLVKHGVSALAVVDGHGRVIGAASRTDLLRRTSAHARAGGPLLVIPEGTVREVMTHGALTVEDDATVAEAAREMIGHGMHRVFVEHDGALAGVLSARDVIPAVANMAIDTPIVEHMSTPVFIVGADEGIGAATDLLDQAGISGVFVVENDWPIGVYTQANALQARDMHTDTPVRTVMDTAIFCVTGDTALDRAAREAHATSVRRVVVADRRGILGVLTALDFVRAAM